MLQILAGYGATVAVLIILAVLVILAIRKIVKDKKAGVGSCGCKCSECPKAGYCKDIKKDGCE